ncbi:hypothetical protein EDEG_01467, partial [Edhazardia aedis USNM 41457]
NVKNINNGNETCENVDLTCYKKLENINLKVVIEDQKGIYQSIYNENKNSYNLIDQKTKNIHIYSSQETQILSNSVKSPSKNTQKKENSNECEDTHKKCKENKRKFDVIKMRSQEIISRMQMYLDSIITQQNFMKTLIEQAFKENLLLKNEIRSKQSQIDYVNVKYVEELKKELKMSKNEVKEIQQRLDSETFLRENLQNEIRELTQKLYKKTRSKKIRDINLEVNLIKFTGKGNRFNLLSIKLEINSKYIFIGQDKYYLSNIYIFDLKENELYFVNEKQRKLILKIAIISDKTRRSTSCSSAKSEDDILIILKKEQNTLKNIDRLLQIMPKTSDVYKNSQEQRLKCIERIEQLKKSIQEKNDYFIDTNNNKDKYDNISNTYNNKDYDNITNINNNSDYNNINTINNNSDYNNINIINNNKDKYENISNIINSKDNYNYNHNNINITNNDKNKCDNITNINNNSDYNNINITNNDKNKYDNTSYAINNGDKDKYDNTSYAINNGDKNIEDYINNLDDDDEAIDGINVTKVSDATDNSIHLLNNSRIHNDSSLTAQSDFSNTESKSKNSSFNVNDLKNGEKSSSIIDQSIESVNKKTVKLTFNTKNNIIHEISSSSNFKNDYEQNHSHQKNIIKSDIDQNILNKYYAEIDPKNKKTSNKKKSLIKVSDQYDNPFLLQNNNKNSHIKEYSNNIHEKNSSSSRSYKQNDDKNSPSHYTKNTENNVSNIKSPQKQKYIKKKSTQNKIYEFNNHTFILKKYTQQQTCNHCDQIISSSSKEILVCTECEMYVHNCCYVLVENSCEMYKALQYGKILYVTLRSTEDKNRLIDIFKN